MTAQFQIEALAARHDRKSFSCGVFPLDRYLKEQAGQDIKRRAAMCYVACPQDSDQIAVYYTLSAGDVALKDMPEDVTRRLPRYPVIPVARVGRLAIDTEFKGKRLGAALLWDAANRARRSEMGVFALAVDAKDEQAAAFYRHFGFIDFQSKPQQLFLPLATIAKSA
ncbi:GNAT family N-acetyltransferase [Neorhizobium galegae]|uniref:GNAT family N-acetyltransferase n=1 Tax=Neorhizobium galegae TaxID=399 RepID=UPI00127286BE|nr:GNAT family N-acetyltransferase [Neorhizobium galegae]KAA9382969.1 GNAT family N-acetyltransferase [Neorhizobium galegae]MCM2498932.1 GNAT family N-acetyltransferase [Neorhizobium galegae]